MAYYGLAEYDSAWRFIRPQIKRVLPLRTERKYVWRKMKLAVA